VKLSILGRHKFGALPYPKMFGICAANEADITMGREMLANASNIHAYGDRGYTAHHGKRN